MVGEAPEGARDHEQPGLLPHDLPGAHQLPRRLQMPARGPRDLALYSRVEALRHLHRQPPKPGARPPGSGSRIRPDIVSECVTCDRESFPSATLKRDGARTAPASRTVTAATAVERAPHAR